MRPVGTLAREADTSVPPATSPCPTQPADARLGAEAAYASRFLVCSACPGWLALFSPRKRRWRRWHLSAPWRYSCCLAYLAAQVAAWRELVSGSAPAVGRWCWGRKGVREVGIWPFPGLVATDGIFPRWVLCRADQSTTHVYPATRLLPYLLLGEPQSSTMLRPPAPAGKVICMSLIPVSKGSRTRAVLAALAARNQCCIGQASPRES